MSVEPDKTENFFITYQKEVKKIRQPAITNLFFKKTKILIPLLLLSLALVFTVCVNDVSATSGDIINVNDSSENNVSDGNNTTVNETTNNTAPENISTVNLTPIDEGGCCSVLVHVEKGYDVFAYRRDATYEADLYIQTIDWYGKEAIKEYKTSEGYFFHTIISRYGWIVATGGADVPVLDSLEDLGGRISVAGLITSSDIDYAASILRGLGMGHFIIKAPNDDVGLVIYNGGIMKTALFRMSAGVFVSVPNGPEYYRTGYTSTLNPVASAIDLETTDGWGVNRRNIITYEVIMDNYATNVKIWASTCRLTPDNIIFLGQTIWKNSIPGIPYKMYIGEVILKDPKTPYKHVLSYGWHIGWYHGWFQTWYKVGSKWKYGWQYGWAYGWTLGWFDEWFFN